MEKHPRQREQQRPGKGRGLEPREQVYTFALAAILVCERLCFAGLTFFHLGGIMVTILDGYLRCYRMHVPAFT